MTGGKIAAVYVMADEAGRHKVGNSCNPQRRSFQILEGGRRLRVVHESRYSEQACKIEKTAHRLLKLAGKHIEGEWFSASLDECIEAISRAEAVVAGEAPAPENPDGTMVVTIRLGPNDVKELRDIAEAEHRKLANYLAMVIEKHLADVREKRGAKKREKA